MLTKFYVHDWLFFIFVIASYMPMQIILINAYLLILGMFLRKRSSYLIRSTCKFDGSENVNSIVSSHAF